MEAGSVDYPWNVYIKEISLKEHNLLQVVF